MLFQISGNGAHTRIGNVAVIVQVILKRDIIRHEPPKNKRCKMHFSGLSEPVRKRLWGNGGDNNGSTIMQFVGRNC